jgi:transcriptional regulator with XRE-family HTH domain
MADSNSLTLGQQLAMRAKTFCNNLGLTQNKLARLLQVDDSQFSRFLKGTANLSSEKTLKLVRLLSCSKRDLELKFGSPERLTSRITKLQESGRKIIHFDNGDGWVAGQSGTDSNGSTDITGTNANPARNVPDADELEFLAGLAGIHQSIIDQINNWQAQTKVVPNKIGSTKSPRYTPDNAISSKPGPRGDKFSRC